MSADTPTQDASGPIRPVHIDYSGTQPVDGDHLAIPAALWSDMCWLAGAASVHLGEHPIVKRARDGLATVFPVIRFGAGERHG